MFFIKLFSQLSKIGIQNANRIFHVDLWNQLILHWIIAARISITFWDFSYLLSAFFPYCAEMLSQDNWYEKDMVNFSITCFNPVLVRKSLRMAISRETYSCCLISLLEFSLHWISSSIALSHKPNCSVASGYFPLWQLDRPFRYPTWLLQKSAKAGRYAVLML